MSENEVDPAGSTQQFRAFQQSEQQGVQKSSRGLIIGVAVVIAVVVIAVMALLTL